jgi:hypothetical protein
MIEEEHGLEMDLLKLEMELLPEDLMSWSRNKSCFDRIDGEGVEQENIKLERRIGKKRAEKECKPGPVGKLEARSFQQLLGDCGEYYTNEQIQNFMLINQAFLDVMAQLRARNARKNEFADDIQASKIDSDDKGSLYVLRVPLCGAARPRGGRSTLWWKRASEVVSAPARGCPVARGQNNIAGGSGQARWLPGERKLPSAGKAAESRAAGGTTP